MRLVILFCVYVGSGVPLRAADPDASNPHEVLEIESSQPSLSMIYSAYEQAHLDWAYSGNRSAQLAFQRALLALIREHAENPRASTEKLTDEDYERISQFAPSPAALVPALRSEHAEAALERLKDLSGLLRSEQHRQEFVNSLASTYTFLTVDTWKDLSADLQPEVTQRLAFLDKMQDETPHHRVMALLQFEPSAKGYEVRKWKDRYADFLQDPSARLAADSNSGNLYARLGVAPWATKEEIDAAYDRLREQPEAARNPRLFEAWVVLSGENRKPYDHANYRFNATPAPLSRQKVTGEMVGRADSIALLKAIQETYGGGSVPSQAVVEKFQALVKNVREPGVLKAYIDYHTEAGRPPESWELDLIQKALSSEEINAMNKWIGAEQEPRSVNARWLRLLSFIHGTGTHLELAKIPFQFRSTVEPVADLIERWATQGGRAALASYREQLQQALNRRQAAEQLARPPQSVARLTQNWYRGEWTVPSLALVSTPFWASEHWHLAGAAAAVVAGVRLSRGIRDRFSLFHSQNQEALKTENESVGDLQWAVKSMQDALQLPATTLADHTPSANCLGAYKQLGIERK